MGGFAGATVKMAIQKGVARGVFSNESGLDLHPLQHAAAKTNEPVEQGLISMTGTFIDTIIICSLTGLSLLVSGEWMAKGSTSTPDSGYVYRRLWPSRRHHSDPMFSAFCDHDHSWMVLLRRAVFRIPFWCQTYQPLSDLLCFYGWTREASLSWIWSG